METWKDVVGYSGIYKVSSDGNVINSRCEKLKPHISSKGYSHLTLYNCGSKKKWLTHRIVAGAFIRNPDNKSTVNHIDGDKTNNRVENLEWATHSENVKHYYNVLNGVNGFSGRVGKLNSRSIPVAQIDVATGHVIKIFDSMRCAERAGFRHSQISRCCSGSLKTHLGFKWKINLANQMELTK